MEEVQKGVSFKIFLSDVQAQLGQLALNCQPLSMDTSVSGLLPQPVPDRLQPPAMLGDPIQQGTMTWLLQPLELHSGKYSLFVLLGL